jgi:hypothetical protein
MNTKRYVGVLIVVSVILVSCVPGAPTQQSMVSTNTMPMPTETLVPTFTATQTQLPTSTSTPLPTATPTSTLRPTSTFTPAPSATPTLPYDWEGLQNALDPFYMEVQRNHTFSDFSLKLKSGYPEVMIIVALDSSMIKEPAVVTVDGAEIVELLYASDEYGPIEFALISDGSAEVIIKNVIVPFFYYLPKPVGAEYFEQRRELVEVQCPEALHSVYVILVQDGQSYFFGKLFAADKKMLPWNGVFSP